MDFPAAPFWDFSIDLYSRPGVGAACLALQDRHGIDVNILLFCLWLGRDGYPAATETEMKTYREAVDPWHQEAVRGLRAVRKWMKAEHPPVDHALAQSLRARLQKIEIDTEHLEQVTLFNCICTTKAAVDERTALDNAVANARLYFRGLGIDPHPEDRRALGEIVEQAFPGQAESTVAAALSRSHM